MERPQIKIADKEKRTVSHKVEVRNTEDGKESREIFGYAAKFDQESENLGGFVEVIERGAFDNVLNDDVRALFNHQDWAILARTASGTLDIGVDNVGLWYRFDSPETSFGNDLLVSVRRGDISQSSFQFIVNDDTWTPETREGETIWKRSIKEVKSLFDVAPVTFPAYSTTEVVARSLSEAKAANTPTPETQTEQTTTQEPNEDSTKFIELRKRKIQILKLKNQNVRALAA